MGPTKLHGCPTNRIALAVCPTPLQPRLLEDPNFRPFFPGAVELRNEIGRSVGLSLPGTLVFDYPTTTAIVAFLQTKMPAATASPTVEQEDMAMNSPSM